MKSGINYLLSILLSLVTVLLIISLFLFNKRFISKVVVKNKLNDVVYKEIDKDINEDFDLDEDLLELDIKRYIDNGYYLNVNNKIKVNGELKYEDIYSKNIKLFSKFNIYELKSTIYFITFLILIITGILFIKTKTKHKIDLIILFSGIIDIIIYGLIYVFNNFSLSELIIVNVLLHILLFIGCLLICSSIVLLNETRIKRILSCK